MADYISREAFKGKYLCCGYLPEMPEKEFDEFPAADVAPVVRCRDCRNSYEVISGRCCSHGPCAGCFVPDDFFCGHGERRTDNENR